MNFRWILFFFIPVSTYSQDGIMLHCNCEGAACDTVLLVFNEPNHTEFRILNSSAEISYCDPGNLWHYIITDPDGKNISDHWNSKEKDSVISAVNGTEIYMHHEEDNCVISYKYINSKQVVNWHRKNCYHDSMLVSSTICSSQICETVVNTYTENKLTHRQHWILDSGGIPFKIKEEHFVPDPDQNGVIISITDKDDQCQSIYRLRGKYFNQ